MDNIKLAIDYLIKNSYKMVEDSNNYAVQSVKLAIESFENQIPKEPSWEGGISFYDDAEAYCPKCDYYFKEDFSYCPDCGQKILWP